ncbi:hypothetical protein PAXRUDRAFT_833254 [Paxillus rubicundulus Ve08.2h10]|uniref:Unplaced genomic scaffold scaffold_1088, whole genome shotgun sequence n=1 Tax=Paxillus rubicundulus Ve08.2h10 TaxID=930991 RepID=A0A0D0DHH5_9AGAM|nr:hypothetical protein PAXRUDRAFT_833254 [Paxillus rubicundulus Ve08.2h10]
MEVDDVVDTSDIEERETFELFDTDHWAFSPPRQCKRDDLAALPQTIVQQSDVQRGSDPFKTLTPSYELNDSATDSPSPRKRIKISHYDGSMPSGSLTRPTSTAASQFMFPSSTPAKRSPMPLVMPVTSRSMRSQSVPFSSSRYESPRSDWNSLFSSPPPALHFSNKQRPPDIHHTRQRSSNPSSTYQPLPNFLSSRSRSPSTGPWCPFPSPLRHPSTPPPTSSFRSCDQPSLKGREEDETASSPLTTISSPTRPTPVPSPSPDPLQLISPVHRCSPIARPSSPLPNHSRFAPDLPAYDAPPVVPEDLPPLGRYSLRRREARQLNPYAYDKLLYKQQMKSNPDAIVKLRSPRPRSRSRGADEDGTQGEYTYALDNPDQDGDYVDQEEGSRRRRRRKENVDRMDDSREEGGEQGAGVTDEGWLPETLKALSSSDDDGDEIRKLAKQVRRAKKKAETKARAEARKLATEAREAGAGVRKGMMMRPKAFPVHGPIGYSGHHPDPDGSEVQSLPTLFTRGRSEPAMDSYTPSPPKIPPKCRPSPSLVSSHSPIPTSNPRHSPSFDYDFQQDEDLYQFNDVGPFLRDHSPANVGDFEPLESPSAPPTTSNPSVVASDTSEPSSDSDPDPPSTSTMSAKDRRRLRALRRMMPAAMIARQVGGNKIPPPLSMRSRTAVVSSGSEAEEVRMIPGLAKVRKGRYRDVEVKGDPESPDVERPVSLSDVDVIDDEVLGMIEVLSDGASAVKVTRRQETSLEPGHADEIISISDGSSLASSSEDSESMNSEEEHGHQSLFDRPPRGPARERSLIDWMLNRTRDASRPKKPKLQRSRASGKSYASGKPRLSVVTSGARGYGEQHQTLLPFVKATTTLHAPTSEARRNTEHYGQVMPFNKDVAQERKTRKKRIKKQHATGQGPVYNLHHDATRITSKNREDKSNRGRNALVIERHDNDFCQALDPGWRAEIERWNKPTPPVRHLAANPSASALDAPRPRLHRRISPQPQNESPPPCVLGRSKQSDLLAHRRIVTDINITPFPSGVKFGPSTYVGKGLLHQLVSVTTEQLEAIPPMSCNMQGFDIGPTTCAAVFSALFGPLCDRLIGSLCDGRTEDVGKMQEWEQVLRVSCQLVSWLAVHAEDEEFVTLETALREYSDGLLCCLNSLEASLFSLTAHWFVVELSARLAVGVRYRRRLPQQGHLVKSAKQLMHHIMDIDLQPVFAIFHEAANDVETTSLPYRAAELWICLIHLFQSCESSSETVPGHSFWRLFAELYPESSSTGAEASEDVWRMLFSLCALSQFSVHGLSTSTFRLPAAWDLVANALKKIVLTANPDKERQLPPRVLKKRDHYLSCVVSRCFLLWSQWGWRLDDAMAMFKSLQEIFRSRNFVNLLNERSAPMGFLENSDLELLFKRDPHDSVFEVFLKMVVQAVYSLNSNLELDPKQRSANIKKLLQMAVPVSPVPFSRSSPPSPHALSMLVNRFSAMAVAIHLDPTPPNVKFRIGQARRCVSFKDADDNSRVACVYGMMYFAMIVRHNSIVGGLEEVLGWLGEMADVLMDEYKEAEASTGARKRAIMMLVQLLIGSVRRVIETQSLDKGRIRVEYPDPALLDGPWITRVFNPRTDLVTIAQTGVEIRMLVRSFLNERLKALPQVQLPPPTPIVHSTESQESQDEYDKLFLDLDDAELLAALGDEPEIVVVTDLKTKEDALCKVLDKSITPAVYRLVCKHFGESDNAMNHENNLNITDEWIDCWVGCANVLVQNNHKDWGLYMKLGQQSWEKIIDSSWRRRVGLRFNLTLLRLDPGAYTKLKDEFIGVLLVATLSCKTTIEHEFMSVVFSLDGLQHPLLQGAPFEPVPEARKFEITQGKYEAARTQLIETVFSNVARCLRAKLDAESQTYAEFVVTMLSTMRDIYQVTAAPFLMF